MMNQKNTSLLDTVISITLIAVVLNLTVPVHAETSKIATQTAAPLASAKTAITTLSLPVIPDKPVMAKKKIVVRSSAYSSTHDQTDNDPFTTASGSKVRDGIVAMNGVPFGTKIRIPQYYGDKIFVVEDRMHSRWGKKRVDIWMPSRQLAREWGVRTVTVEVL